MNNRDHMCLQSLALASGGSEHNTRLSAYLIINIKFNKVNF
jgi:hypothetical protein